MALRIIADQSFKIKLPARKWKELFRAFKAMQPRMKKTKNGTYYFDLPIQVTPDYTSMKCMDASHIAMMIAIVKREECLSYSCSKETIISVGLHRCLKVLNSMLDNEIVSIEFDNGELELNTVQALDDTKTLRKNYRVKSEIAHATSPIPRLTPTAKFNIHSATLSNILRSLASNGDTYFKLIAKNNSLSFSSNATTIAIPEWDIDLKQESKASYSLETIQTFLASSSGGILTMEYESAMPLKISYPGIEYYIAPRIADDDEKKSKEKAS